MTESIHFRNVAINSYVGIFAITVIGGFATLYIVHVANDVPFSAFATPAAYAIDASL